MGVVGLYVLPAVAAWPQLEDEGCAVLCSRSRRAAVADFAFAFAAAAGDVVFGRAKGARARDLELRARQHEQHLARSTLRRARSPRRRLEQRLDLRPLGLTAQPTAQRGMRRTCAQISGRGKEKQILNARHAETDARARARTYGVARELRENTRRERVSCLARA